MTFYTYTFCNFGRIALNSLAGAWNRVTVPNGLGLDLELGICTVEIGLNYAVSVDLSGLNPDQGRW